MPQPQKKLRDSFAGALLGTFVGDALGMPVEGWSSKRINKEYGEIKEMLPGRLEKGSYTDDTEMMIALVSSIVRCRGIDQNDLARSLAVHFLDNRGYGRGAKKIIKLLRTGVPWQEAAIAAFPDGSFGNGAAMRTAPVGCLYWDDPDKLRFAAERAAEVTHTHPLGREGAVLQSFAVALAMRQRSSGDFTADHFLSALERFTRPDIKDYLYAWEKVAQLLSKDASKARVKRELGNSVKAQRSVPTAIYCYLSHLGSLEDTITYAVSIGGDTDTIAAMAGAIAGARYGKEAIPKRWWNAMENGEWGRNRVWQLAADLYNLWEQG